ncbi:MAG: 1,4-dihydroxy-2-naphthoate octaprenyltransferase [Bacteroidaceae bacterium]|nr:1,4-dihydroxy-2-naphthoate octaprenyltransferase [Bacteroidaceae bacterium]
MGEVKQNSLKAWFLAARPKTLTSAAVPVMAGVATAYTDFTAHCANHHLTFGWTAALLCFLFALIMQIDANLINDFYDFVKGSDREDRLGPERACAQGWVSLGAMKHAIAATTTLGCVVGLPLVYYGGLEMIAVGALCVVFCFLYTTCLSYMGLGDVLVLVFFGLVPVCTTYYIQMHTLTWGVALVALAVGLVVDALLIVNNYRDIEQDRLSNKNTLITKLGKQNGQRLYLAIGFAGCAMAFAGMWLTKERAITWPLMGVYLTLHLLTWKRMVEIDHGKELNKVLGATARNILLFGVLLTIVILT